MANPPRGREQNAVWIEVDGRRVSGTYVVWDGWISVTSEHGIKRAEVGRLPADVLARLLLRELVADSKKGTSR
jgi:hypothetical protein